MKGGTKNIGEEMKRWAGRLRKYQYVFLVLAVGLFLLLLPEGTEKTKTPNLAAASSDLEFDLDRTERELEGALSQIEGAGDVTVVLTLRSGSRRVLAQDTQTNQRESSLETDKSTVIVSQGSGMQDVVLLQEIYPSFQGAFVVCSGGDDPGIRLKILEAVSALTGLSTDKISICKGK